MQLADLQNNDRIFAIPFDDTVTIRLRHITREELRNIYKQATTTRFVNHVKTEEFDPIKGDCLLGRAAIKGWDGIKNGDQDAPCTPEFIDLLMSKHNSFAKFINDISADIDQLIKVEREAERKNSKNSSGQE